MRPTLEYFSIDWDSCFARDIEKIEKVQQEQELSLVFLFLHLENPFI